MEKAELVAAEKNIERKGFFDVEIDPTLDLFGEIERLKKEKNAIVLAHYYQEPDIQDVADYIGDSLGLAQQAEKTKADMIVFAGVHFMAETAKILNPSKKVVIPDLKAGCSLSEGCPPPLFKKFKEKYPDHKVVSYINCSAGIKALSDVICTSSNAKAIVEIFPKDQPIIFAPDKNLGAYINKITGSRRVGGKPGGTALAPGEDPRGPCPLSGPTAFPRGRIRVAQGGAVGDRAAGG